MRTRMYIAATIIFYPLCYCSGDRYGWDDDCRYDDPYADLERERDELVYKNEDLREENAELEEENERLKKKIKEIGGTIEESEPKVEKRKPQPADEEMSPIDEIKTKWDKDAAEIRARLDENHKK